MDCSCFTIWYYLHFTLIKYRGKTYATACICNELNLHSTLIKYKVYLLQTRYFLLIDLHSTLIKYKESAFWDICSSWYYLHSTLIKYKVITLEFVLELYHLHLHSTLIKYRVYTILSKSFSKRIYIPLWLNIKSNH